MSVAPIGSASSGGSSPIGTCGWVRWSRIPTVLPSNHRHRLWRQTERNDAMTPGVSSIVASRSIIDMTPDAPERSRARRPAPLGLSSQ